MNYEETKLRKALAICVGDDCDGCPLWCIVQTRSTNF